MTTMNKAVRRSALIGTLGLLFWSTFFVSAASAQISCSTYLYDMNLYLACVGGAGATADNTTPVLPAGTVACATGSSAINLAATGWATNSTVNVSLQQGTTTVSLGTISINGTGAGSGAFTIAGNQALVAGPASIVLSGTNLQEQQTTFPIAITLSDCTAVSTTTSTTTGTLPFTGSESRSLTAFALAMILVGGAAVFGSVKAKRAQSRI